MARDKKNKQTNKKNTNVNSSTTYEKTKKRLSGTSLVVQWLRCTYNAGDTSSNPGQGIKIPHAMQKKTKQNKNRLSAASLVCCKMEWRHTRLKIMPQERTKSMERRYIHIRFKKASEFIAGLMKIFFPLKTVIKNWNRWLLFQIQKSATENSKEYDKSRKHDIIKKSQ